MNLMAEADPPMEAAGRQERRRGPRRAWGADQDPSADRRQYDRRRRRPGLAALLGAIAGIAEREEA